jgi:uncharacterized membrane protein
MSFVSDSKKILKTRFISGLLIVVPLILTFVLLRALVEFIDGLLLPIVTRLFGQTYDFPFIGVIVTIAIVLLAGIFTANILGNRLLRIWEKLILRIPIIRFIYGAAQQLVRALSLPQGKSFKSVVMVEYPRRGIHTLGFLASETTVVSDDDEKKMLTIFIPSTPTPISGYAMLFPADEVYQLSMTVEEGVKFFVSGGIISPEMIKLARKAALDEGLDETNELSQETGVADEIK